MNQPFSVVDSSPSRWMLVFFWNRRKAIQTKPKQSKPTKSNHPNHLPPNSIRLGCWLPSLSEELSGGHWTPCTAAHRWCPTVTHFETWENMPAYACVNTTNKSTHVSGWDDKVLSTCVVVQPKGLSQSYNEWLIMVPQSTIRQLTSWMSITWTFFLPNYHLLQIPISKWPWRRDWHNDVARLNSRLSPECQVGIP